MLHSPADELKSDSGQKLKSETLEKDAVVALPQYHSEREPISDKQKSEEAEKLLALLGQNVMHGS